MRWEAWVLAVWLVLMALIIIGKAGQLGRPRPPKDSASVATTAAINIIEVAVMFWLVLRLGSY